MRYNLGYAIALVLIFLLIAFFIGHASQGSTVPNNYMTMDTITKDKKLYFPAISIDQFDDPIMTTYKRIAQFSAVTNQHTSSDHWRLPLLSDAPALQWACDNDPAANMQPACRCAWTSETNTNSRGGNLARFVIIPYKKTISTLRNDWAVCGSLLIADKPPN